MTDLRYLEKAVEALKDSREWLESIGRKSGVLSPEDRDRMAVSVRVIEDVCRGRLDELALELEGVEHAP